MIYVILGVLAVAFATRIVKIDKERVNEIVNWFKSKKND